MERTIVKTRIPFVISIFNLNPFLNILIAIVNIEKAITTHTNKVKKEYNWANPNFIDNALFNLLSEKKI